MSKSYDPLASVQAAGPPGTISFVYGLPDPVTFPTKELSFCFEKVFQEKASLALQYGPEQGYGPLIDFLREKLGEDENIFLSRSQIMLTGGASQALDHICTMFTQQGDIIIVEAPSYHESLQLFRDHGLRTFQVNIDEEGMNVEELKAVLEKLRKRGERAKFLYIIPSFQNPSGISLSLKRKKAILEVVEDWDLLVVEDDVYYDLAFEEMQISSLFVLNRGRRVIRLGSFSKILAPGLRMGWMIAPTEFIRALTESGLRRMGGGSNPLLANAISVFCQKGWLESHIKSIRSHYRAKRDVILKSLETKMPESVSWARPKGGFFIWVRLPHDLQAVDVVKWVQKSGIMILAGDHFFAEYPTGQYLRLAFSYIKSEKIKEGIEKLSQIIKSHLK